MTICDSFFGSLCRRPGLLTCLILNSELSEQPPLPYRNLWWRPVKPESTYRARNKCGEEQTTVWSAVPYSRYRSKENQMTQHLGHLPVHVPSALLCSCVFCASAIWFCIVYQLATFWQGPVKPNYKNTRAGRSRHSVICYSLCDCTQCRDKEKQTTWRLCRLPVCVCCLLLSSALASLSFAWGTKPALRGWNVAQERPENLVNCVQYTYLHAAGIW